MPTWYDIYNFYMYSPQKLYIMDYNTELIETLNDLVQINNDRIEGYGKAIRDSKAGDMEYHPLFKKLMEQSYQYKQELINEINKLGGSADIQETTSSGKVYRVWMDIKSAFTGKTEASVLELCEFGEDAAQKAYHEALTSSVSMPADTRELIRVQKAKLKESHDLIKRSRDMAV